MINRIVLMGRLTADPELKTTTSGLFTTSFTVAVDRSYSSNGERKTDFIPCVAWRKDAEFICNYFRKGNMIAVEGCLFSRQYEDRNGQKRTAYDVSVDGVSFCGEKKEQTAPAAQTAPAPAAPTPTQMTLADAVDDDDLPF